MITDDYFKIIGDDNIETGEIPHHSWHLAIHYVLVFIDVKALCVPTSKYVRISPTWQKHVLEKEQEGLQKRKY